MWATSCIQVMICQVLATSVWEGSWPEIPYFLVEDQFLEKKEKSPEYALCVCAYMCKYIHIFLTQYISEWSLKITELVKLTLETPGPTSNSRPQFSPELISLLNGFFHFWKLIKYLLFPLFFYIVYAKWLNVRA